MREGEQGTEKEVKEKKGRGKERKKMQKKRNRRKKFINRPAVEDNLTFMCLLDSQLL